MSDLAMPAPSLPGETGKPTGPRFARWFQPTGASIFLVIAPVLTFIAANVDRNYQTDLWHHLARGREIVQRGEILNVDVFTCTVSGQPFQDVNWLSQVCLYELYQLGGLPLLQACNGLLLSATIALVVGLCRRASGSVRVAAAAGIFTFLGLWQLVLIRPQTFSFLLFAGLYTLLDSASRRPWLLLFAPAFLALWVNLHGAFPIGLVLIGAYLLARIVEVWPYLRGRTWYDPMTRRLALCLVVSTLATLANPYGWNVYLYVGATSATAAARGILEWQPISLGMLVGKAWLASHLLTFLAFALPWRRPVIRDVCLVLCFLPISCSAVRMVGWWLIVIAPILAASFAAALPRSFTDDAELNQRLPTDRYFAILIVLATLGSLPWLERINPFLRLTDRLHRVENDLQAIVNDLQESGKTGNLFSRLEWGEYLEWSLHHPDFLVFIDGRIEIYDNQVWDEYYAVTDARFDWEDILDRHEVRFLVLDRRIHRDLNTAVEKSSRWRLDSERGVAMLYVRKG